MLTAVERNHNQLKKDIEYCVSIGARVFVLHPHPLTLRDRKSINKFKDRYAKAAEYGLKKGVRLAVHSCGLDVESWDVMFDAIPQLGLKYDPSFSAQAGRSWRSEILRYGKRIIHTHAKDEILIRRVTDTSNGIIEFRYAPAGMGDINWGSFIALLYEINYKGDIAIEPHGGVWSGKYREQGLMLAKRHLEQFIFK